MTEKKTFHSNEIGKLKISYYNSLPTNKFLFPFVITETTIHNISDVPLPKLSTNSKMEGKREKEKR